MGVVGEAGTIHTWAIEEGIHSPFFQRLYDGTGRARGKEAQLNGKEQFSREGDVASLLFSLSSLVYAEGAEWHTHTLHLPLPHNCHPDLKRVACPSSGAAGVLVHQQNQEQHGSATSRTR